MGRLAERLATAGPLRGVRPETAEAVAEHARERSLRAGETLVAEGERSAHVCFVLAGRLHAVVDHGTATERVLGTLEAGSVVGEIAGLIGGRREATVVATEEVTVLEVSPAGFELLLEREPELALRLAELAATRLRTTQLSRQVAALFPDADDEVLAALLAEAEWVGLAPGETLVERGEPADAAYVVVSGRLRGLAEEGDLDDRADVGPGELVGEMALVEGGTRGATLVAVRETHAARLRREHLLTALKGHPEAVMGVARTALRRASTGQGTRGGERRAVALVAAHPTVDLAGLAESLLPTLEAAGSARLLSPQEAAEPLEGLRLRGASDGPALARLAQWLHEQEQRYETLLLVGGDEDGPWNEVVLRHADHVAVVADATADPALTPVERRVAEALRPSTDRHAQVARLRTSLVLVHESGRAEPPRGTARWLAERTVDACYHVRLGHPRDHARLARILAERPVSLVLSGGGARGYAHLGVVRALEEAGVPIDLVGGTSMGAVIATFVALDLDADERAARARETTVRSPLDWTLPVASLVKGSRLAERAEREVGRRDMEDLWLPCFAVSTNLTRNQVAVHRRGPAARAVRASVAIPGLVPPVAVDGDLHVDGGVLDNLPVRQMRQLNPRGPVIAVDVATSAGPRAPADFGLAVSGWSLLAQRVLPGREPVEVPGIATTLMHSMVTASCLERDRIVDEGLADLYLDLELPRCGLLQFDAADSVIAAGYDAAAARVRAWASARTIPAG